MVDAACECCTITLVHMNTMPLPFLINPSAPVPIFQQIADGLRAAIGRGAFPTGSLLPSVRSIAEELGVTTNNAHQLLFRTKKRLTAGIRSTSDEKNIVRQFPS